MGHTLGESGDRKTCFKKLLSSVSGAALLLGVAVGSVRGGTTITTATGPVVNAGTTDFIFIDTGGIVFGSVTNTGVLGVPPFTVPQPLVVKGTGIVTGSVVNATPGLIFASGTGIRLSGATPFATIFGGITNSGIIDVLGSGSINGIRITGSTVATTVGNGTFGLIHVSLSGTGTGTANGINITSTGSLAATITNSGLIDIDVFFTGAIPTQSVSANGVIATNAAGGGPIATVGFTNSGVIDVHAFAVDPVVGFGNAFATAKGANLVAVGTSGASSASVTATNAFAIAVRATAFGFGSATANPSATATGIRQGAVGSAALIVDMTNSGLMDVDAKASAVASGTATADANAVGLFQNASGTAASATIDIDLINSSGTIVVDAIADASAGFGIFTTLGHASAIATGVRQAGSGATSGQTIDIVNSGIIAADAFASADGLMARANASALAVDQRGLATGAVGTISLGVSNTKSMIASASADATGATARAVGSAGGVLQGATGGAVFVVGLTNSGTIDVDAKAFARGTKLSARATAFAFGTNQFGVPAGGAPTTNSLNTTNSGMILVDALAVATKATTNLARATAIGGAQSAGGGTAINITATNSGLIDASATARATSGGVGSADAIATGQFQLAFATKATVTNSASFSNTSSGTIDVDASARATNVDNGTASATAVGVNQRLIGGAVINGIITNNGIIDVDAFATAVAPLSLANARASAMGTAQFASGPGSTSNILSVNNSGVIDAHATALAFGFTGKALAIARGAPQVAIGGATISVSLTNSASITAHASASATGSGALATASAAGVRQAGTGTTKTLTNTLSLINTSTGSIDVDATAKVFGSNASAFAIATGVEQSAVGGAVISVTASNSGLIDVEAFASATGGSSPFGSATAVGIDQFASGTKASTSLSNDFTNTPSGILAVDATVIASSTYSAFANATGVLQSAIGVGTTFVQTITNDGLIDVRAFVSATTGTSALMNAGALGAFQFASNTGSATSVSNTLTNSSTGIIDIDAIAFALDIGFLSIARASATGFYQTARFGGAVTNTLTNAGSIDIAASASVPASFTFASAQAFARGGSQVATANNTKTSTAINTFTNSSTGSFAINATAKAAPISGSSASAFASAEGFFQTAVSATTVSNTFTNNGSFDLVAFASAAATIARAFATINTGVAQSASANGASASSATNTLTNTSNLSFNVTATASAFGATQALASGSVSSNVIFQSATGVGTANNSITNSGTMSLLMKAIAIATSTTGNATARLGGTTAPSTSGFGTGVLFYQFGSATTATGGAATNTITNSGTLSLTAMATAVGPNVADASARFEEDVFKQNAFGEMSTNIFTNSGNLTLTLGALATAVSGRASADANLDDSFLDQEAGFIATISTTVTVSGTGTVSSNTFINTNTGMLTLLAQASAFGSTNADAEATFEDELLDQRALGESASATVTNDGNISITMLALADASNGFASADATFDDTVFDQNARFTTSSASPVGSNATITFTNNGSVSILAQASAFGTTGANAQATFGDRFVDQSARAQIATSTFTNSSSIIISALALATATNGFADAQASFDNTFVEQDARATSGTAGSVGTTVFTNTGSIDLIALAIATASGIAATTLTVSWAQASASFDDEIVDQEAFAETAITTLTNSGDISVTLTAFALATNSWASASATFNDTVFDMSANANTFAFGSAGVATQTFTNTNTGSISLLAKATATASGTTLGSPIWARASASFDDDYFELDARAHDATSTFTNNGTIDATLLASAKATNLWADAEATFGENFIDQNAFYSFSGTAVPGSVATATITNTGSITLVAIAMATASGTLGSPSWASAEATFSKDFVEQDARAETATATFTNSGDISVNLTAVATATNLWAKAEATFDDTMFDLSANANTFAFGSAGVATQTFTNTNTGSISFLAKATAIASGTLGSPSFADADASFDDEIFNIDARGYDATSTFTNNGTIDATVLAFAKASNGFADAEADFDDTFINQNVTYSFSKPAALGSVATATVTNSGSITLIAIATAIASGTLLAGRASADAEFDDEIVDQEARAETATTTFTNSGAISVTLTALAMATNSWASASATFNDTVFDLSASANFSAFGTAGVATQTFTNTNTGSISLFAKATATASGTLGSPLWASAEASFDDDIFELDARGHDATSTFTNNGSIDATLLAFAKATNSWASADATFDETFIEQDATACCGNPGSVATATITNTGSIDLFAQATAIASGTLGSASFADAEATMNNEIIDQRASAEIATVTFTNSGTINATLLAFASATNFWAHADATFDDSLIDQHATTKGASAGSVATAIFTNSGSMSFIAQATALGTAGTFTTIGASASATVSQVAHQFVRGETASADFTITSTGSFSVMLTALAVATDSAALASALIRDGVRQTVIATPSAAISATATINNSGSFSLGVVATATAASTASAFAIISSAFFQSASGGATNTVSLTNSGTITLSASANAFGTNAFASASDPGIKQLVEGIGGETETKGEAIITQSMHTPANITNSGTFSITVNAFADGLGGSQATASAFALGALQVLGGGTGASGVASFNNTSSGSFSVAAQATATNATSTESANASATGYVFEAGFANQILGPSVVNSGSFNVNATAIGATAAAFALGMGVSGASVTGSISNSGTMSVTASASGTGTASATAIGIGIASNIFTGTITNTGTINVLAIGSTASAIGIGFIGTTTAFTFTNTVTATGSEVGTITNDGGTLFARVNTGTLDFGTVIDTTDAPNPILINLQGSSQQGNISGNILLSGDDTILVTNGNTIYRGVINGTSTFTGSMTISSAGTLTLGTTGTGPSVAYLNNYTQTSSGTLAVNIFPSSGTNSLGQINAITASLAGTIQANVVAGLYANSQTYQDVVVASTLSGTWSSLTINTNTPLLSLTATYPGDDTADLTLTRNAFTSPAGMTQNQNAAAGGIENTYSTSLTGPYATMIGEMFTFDTSTYISALEQLHGAEYAQNLYSNLGSMALLNYSVDDRMNAGPIASNSRRGSTIIQRGDVAVWARVQGVWGDFDGDIEASGYDQDQKAFYAGVDYAISDNLLIGFVAGYYDNKLRFDNGSRKDDDGVQLGLYAAYDTQQWYIRGIGGYADYNADSVRSISFGTTIGTNMGKYGSTVISFMGEAGRRFEVSPDFYFTPYAGLSYARSKNDAFTETGLAASALTAFVNKAKSFMSNLGIRFTGAWDTGSNSKVIVELAGAWQHEFEDDPVNFTTSFASVSGSTFTVIGSAIDAETLVLNGGVSYTTDTGFEVKVSYWGRFNSNFTENSVGLKVIKRF